MLRDSEIFSIELPDLSIPSPTPSPKERAVLPIISPALVAVVLAISSVVLAASLAALEKKLQELKVVVIAKSVIIFFIDLEY